MENYDLTYEDAKALIDSLNLETAELRHWTKRTDKERLALGLVILRKHTSGKSLRTIEKEMGIPLATCQRYKERALQSLAAPLVEEARKEELERLDKIIEAIWPQVEAGDKDAINSYMKVSERRAKMLGLDKPMEVSATVTEITAAERELQEMLAQAERDAKMAQDALVESHAEA